MSDPMRLFDPAVLREMVKRKPPPGAHAWTVHEVGAPGSGRLIRRCSRCGIERPYPGGDEAPACKPAATTGAADQAPGRAAGGAGCGCAAEPHASSQLRMRSVPSLTQWTNQ